MDLEMYVDNKSSLHIENPKKIKQIRREKVFERSHGVCLICRKPIVQKDDWTIEHYIPRAVYKWIDAPMLGKQLESMSNLFAVHFRCNLRKSATIPNVQMIKKLVIDDTQKQALLNLYFSVYDSITAYREMKRDVWLRQNK